MTVTVMARLAIGAGCIAGSVLVGALAYRAGESARDCPTVNNGSAAAATPQAKNEPSTTRAGTKLSPFSSDTLATVLLPGWEQYDFPKPKIAMYGLMTGKVLGEAGVVEVRLSCDWPLRSDPNFRSNAQTAEQWNCSLRSFRWTKEGPVAFNEDYIGYAASYHGGWYVAHDQRGLPIPASELQPRLIDAGTGLLFPDISFEGPGELRLICSQPLRDLANKGGADAFAGCKVSWKNRNVPDEAHLEMTIGEKVVVPGLFVDES